MADSENVFIVLLLVFVIFIVMYNENNGKCKNARQGMETQNVSDWGQGVATTTFKEREKNLTGAKYGDYNQMIQAVALEPDVFASQAQYNEGMNRFSSGASQHTQRSDPSDINPFIGLRRIHYNVDVGANSRVVPSQNEDQFDREKSSAWHF